MTELEQRLIDLNEQLTKQVEHLQIQVEGQVEQIDELLRQNANLQKRLFGTSSEKTNKKRPFKQPEQTGKKPLSNQRNPFREKADPHRPCLSSCLRRKDPSSGIRL